MFPFFFFMNHLSVLPDVLPGAMITTCSLEYLVFICSSSVISVITCFLSNLLNLKIVLQVNRLKMRTHFVDCFMLMGTALSLRGDQKLPEMGRPLLQDVFTTTVNISITLSQIYFENVNDMVRNVY